MANDALNEYELQLCDYACGNIREHLDRAGFSELLRAELIEELWVFLANSEVEETTIRQLTNSEFRELAEAVHAWPSLPWRPYIALHKRYVKTVIDVRRELSPQVAEDWSRSCAGFGRRLEQRGVQLADGIDIVRDWVCELRQLRKAMAATANDPSEAWQATNTTPSSADPLQSGNEEQVEVKLLLEAIKKHPKGKKAPAKELIKAVGIANQRGRDLLRELQDQGRYKGFARSRPRRYTTDPRSPDA